MTGRPVLSVLVLPLACSTYTRTMNNRFADMTEEELRTMTRGGGVYRGPRTEFQRDYDPSNHKPVPELPQTVDYRNQGVLTAIKDQGMCGSCCTWSLLMVPLCLVAVCTR